MIQTILLALTAAFAFCVGTDAFAAEEDAGGNRKDISYAIGNLQGAGLLVRIRQEGYEVDIDALLEGMSDALNEKPGRMKREDMQKLLQDEARRIQAAAGERAKSNLAASRKYLDDNASKPGVTTLDSGLQYRVIRAGSGASPSPTDKVTVHYRGTLIDGTEFDSSFRRNKPATFAVNRVIAGWTEALQLMKEGAKWELFIPPRLAYGARSSGKIPANSALIFEVELLSVDSPAKEDGA